MDKKKKTPDVFQDNTPMCELSWVYSDIVKEHFFKPKNLLNDDKGYKADGVGTVGSPACGDVMKVWIKVDPKTEKIKEFKWRTFGCASAIASTSMLSVIVTENKGMNIKQAYKLTPQKILDRLGGLPDRKIHCSVLGDKALRTAIEDYMKKKGKSIEDLKDHSPIVCHCLQVTENDLKNAIEQGAKTFSDVQAITKAGTGCGKCIPKIKKLIKDFQK